MKATKLTIQIALLFVYFSMGLTTITTAQDSINYEIQNGVDQDLLDEYSDDFSSFRDDIWVKLAGFTSKKKQANKLKPLDPVFRNGQVIFETHTGTFSKGAINSKFEFEGDFDIQIDCAFRFVQKMAEMDQLIRLGVWDSKVELVGINFLRTDKKSGHVYSSHSSLERKKRISTSESISMENFSGTIRMIRKGENVYTLFKYAGTDMWEQMGTHKYKTARVKFGFSIQNFNFGRDRISAKYPLQASFSNFRINAAHNIVEGDI